MPNNWKTYKLGEFLEIKNGKTKPKEIGDIPIYGGNGILGFTNKSNVNKDVLIIGRVGAYCGSVYFEVNPVWISDNALYTFPKKDDNLKFIYYLLKQLDLNQFAGGSSQPLLTQDTLNRIEVTLPPLQEQQSIAAILSSIDDKIENNLAINKTLEEMAMALYKHWFVDFGPFQDGEFVESELGRIPKSWQIVQFRELLSLLKDGSHNPPKRVESGVKFIAGATDIKKLEVTFNKCSYITQEDYDKMHKAWEIKEKDVLMTIVGTIGNTAIVQNKDLPFSLQRSIAVFRPIEGIPNYFIYLLINNESFKEYVKAHTNPTGQPGIYLKILGNYNLAQPNYEILQQFNYVIEPLFDQMFSNLSENQTLTQLRDTLLPKLISGEVRLKEFVSSEK